MKGEKRAQRFGVGLAVGLGLALGLSMAGPGCDGSRSRDQTAPPDSPVAPAAAERPAATEKADPALLAFQHAAAMLEQYRYEEASQAFEEVVDANPEWIAARVNLGLAYVNQPKNPDLQARGEVELKQVLKDDPSNPWAHFGLGIYYHSRGSADVALAHFEAAHKFDPDDPYVAYKYAESLQANDRQDESIALLESIVEDDPGFISGLYRLGMLYNRTKQQDKASDLLRRFRDLNSEELSSGSYMIKDPYGAMGRYYMVMMPQPAATAEGQPAATASAPVPFSPEVQAIGDIPLGTWELPGNGGSVKLPGVAVGDLDGDGDLDLVITGLGTDGSAALALNDGKGQFTLTTPKGPRSTSVCLGDVDNDGDLDVWIGGAGGERLYLNDGHAEFTAVWPKPEAAKDLDESVFTSSARLLDLDQDGDLDLLATRLSAGGLPPDPKTAKPSSAQMRINALDDLHDYVDAAAEYGLAMPETAMSTLVADDLDNDRDVDLLLISPTAGLIGWENHRLKAHKIHDSESMGIEPGPAIAATTGDPFQTGRRDLLVATGDELILYRNQGGWRFEREPGFPAIRATGAQFVDIDNDGDLDILVSGAGQGGPSLLINGWPERRFRPIAEVDPKNLLVALENEGPASVAVAADLDGNGTADLVVLTPGQPPRWIENRIDPRRWLAIDLEGKRIDDDSGRSPSSAIGARVEVHAGPVSQTHVVGSPAGATAMPPLRLHVGLADQTNVPWLRILWPDSVLQAELEQPTNQLLTLGELNRRPSSCPHLFVWDGERFAFVSDFGGVGGLGYLVAPGEYAPPDPTEVIRLPELVPTSEGEYVVHIVEPLEEVAYLDEVKLLAVDHLEGTSVWPHEYAPITAPPPPAELFCFEDLTLPVSAIDHRGEDVLDAVRRVDRTYAGATDPDPHYLGYAAPHAVTVDFGDELAGAAESIASHAGERWLLVMDGWVEYSTSTSNYAASQAGKRLEAPSVWVEREGQWVELLREAGYPAGINHAMTLDLTGLLRPGDRKLRIGSNMDISWDLIALGRHRPDRPVNVHTVAAASADLHVLGYPREYSPDGRKPALLDYSNIDRSETWLRLPGSYTRYGDVTPLIQAADDRYVVMPAGDEVTVRFKASDLPSVPSGYVRSYLLHTDSFCKDMDLYTGAGDHVEPWPFHGMSSYPYDASREHTAESKAVADGLREWTTRKIDR